MIIGKIMSKIIDVNEVIDDENRRARLNGLHLNEVTFMHDGNEVKIEEEELNEWARIGLNNISFITGRDW